MPEIEIENKSDSVGVLTNPHGTAYVRVDGGETVRKEVPLSQFKNMKEAITEMESKNIGDTQDPQFEVTLYGSDGNVGTYEEIACEDAGSDLNIEM